MSGDIFISVDGGGTKTEFCIYNTKTGEYSSAFYSGSNYKNDDDREDKMDIAGQFLKTLKDRNISPADIGGAVFGLSGVDSEKDLEYYRKLIFGTGIDPEKVIICNDCEYTLRGLVDGDGMAVVCGTGAIAYGLCGGRHYRTAGWGMPYSDMGCGTWIGGEIIREAIQRLDEGLSDDDPVIGLVKRFRTDDAPLQWTLNELDVPTTASIAFDALKLAEEGDATCQEIVLEAAFHIAGYIRTTYTKMNFQGEELSIVYAGGVNKSPYFRSLLEPVVQKMLGNTKVRWIVPTESAARSGIAYIMREKGR